jgi:DNA-binding transcriptional MerR regulator
VSETIEGDVGPQPYVPNWMNDAIACMRERNEQKRRVETEQAALRAIDKRWKEAGLPLDVIKAVDKLRKRQKPEAEHWIGQFLQVSSVCGILGPQLNIFGAEGYEPTDEQKHAVDIAHAEDEGFLAGRDGLGKDANPHEPGSEKSQAWVKWWGRGVEAAKFVNGGVAPSPANRSQPKARQRRAVEVKALEAPEPSPESTPETPKRRGRPPKANGAHQAAPVKMRGRPPGSKNKPKQAHA